ncbi:hypothetical protein GRF29_96g1143913 [Pseudopithomyces chartarum]|uniref:AD domain-containing protein n=1 Tax=Pseudopithomyces chartarum TaxID=1892770 RepID=A0AAN6LWD8_9PLEO|nr:hypothetical protein GRF29_96g1143913 [Pseudopithomyces chartarum]
MAETKRQSVAGKIATPKAGGPKDTIDGDSVLYKAVGARIKITCAPHNNVLEGTLFTTCNVTNAIAINTALAPLSTQPGNYHIIPFAHILTFELLGPADRVDLAQIRAREEQTIREMKKKDAQRGKGVTKEAQDIFDAVSRLLPTRWSDAQIVVNDAVLIEPPYTIDNLKVLPGKEQSLASVRRIMDQYHQRKKNAAPARAPVATPIAPRKGG